MILEPLYAENISSHFLRAQWLQQINEQSKPLKKQSKDLANKEIVAILGLTKTLEGYKQNVNELQTMLESGVYTDGFSTDKIQILLEEAQQQAMGIQSLILSKK